MGMLVILPILQDNFYYDQNLVSQTILAKYLANNYYLFDHFNATSNDSFFVKFFNETDSSFPTVNITFNGILIYANPVWKDYNFRGGEIQTIVSSDGSVQILYSGLTDTQSTAVLNIGRTIFVCICLTLAAVYFEQDTQELVLQPLEVMIEIVQSVARDPMNAKDIKSLGKGVKSTMQKLESKKSKDKKFEVEDEKYEIKVIQSAIVKISALLAIGFGEAGGEIIKENLSSGSELNPMLKGKRRIAIFGFCDIHNFPDVNEALQERSIVFVNEIAEIVHSSVDQYGGAANKNIGDAFLMVWKFPTPEKDKTKKIKEKLDQIDIDDPAVKQMADMSVLGFLTVILRINKLREILKYRSDNDISKRLLNYRVKMGFGLHLGWAIEGAIGSSYKIDASYLSPNVNMAARLEAATRQYGVSILISGPLFDYLSDDVKEICRLIDIVTVKGSIEPVKFYTVDLNLNVSPQKDKIRKNINGKAKRLKFQSKKENTLKEALSRGSVAKYALNKKSYMELLDTKKTRMFYTLWNEGFNSYINGKWTEACSKFQDCLKIDETDGPCKTLIGYIKSNNSTAPTNWKGFRELTSK